MNVVNNIFLAAASLLFFSAPLPQPTGERTRLNQIQVIGSHNSYKIGIEPPLLNFLFKRDSATARSLQYEHPSLTKQLKIGLRNLELDVYDDPEGGNYSNPAGLDIVKALGQTPLPFDPEEKLKLPGMKVFHIQDIDFRSHQLLFKDALAELLHWSNQNPDHIPVIITINPKDEKVSGLRLPRPFDSEALKRLDDEIRSMLPTHKLITPDLVRGEKNTLEQAVLTTGWPVLDSVRGRFLFVLDAGDAVCDLYASEFPGLKEAALFISKKAGHPNAAFCIVNDPVAEFIKIKTLVSKGYMVRTRADAGTVEARNNDYTRFEKAKASGAQIITTDYYLPGKLFPSHFKVVFANGKYERINE